MTRSIKAACTAAVCAIAIVGAQSAAVSAQAKPAAQAKPTSQAKPAQPARAAQAKPAAKPAVTAMTLTGCLHADGAKFRLSDLPDNQSPKGRSWKTGYIVKLPKDMEVAAASTSIKLKDHVGHKITLTGIRNDDDHFTARAIKHVAPRCS